MPRIDVFNVADFRRSVAENVQIEAVRDAIYESLRFAEENADRIEGGKATLGSFHYQINVKNQTLTLFTCDANGYISVSLGNFSGFRPVVPGALIVRLRDTLAQIPGFESFSKDYTTRPGFSVKQTVVDRNIMVKFQNAILKFQKGVQAL